MWGILIPDCGTGWHAPTWASVFLLAKNMVCGRKEVEHTSTAHAGKRLTSLNAGTFSSVIVQMLPKD